MQGLMRLLARLGDKAGAMGTLVSAMGCAMCFPAIASIGAALGLGFLSHWEGLFLDTLMPLFAGIALAANFLGWFSHRQCLRALLSMTGPAMVLATMYPLWEYDWSTDLLYAGITLMLATAIWDLVSPTSRRCADDSCATPKKNLAPHCDKDDTMSITLNITGMTCDHCAASVTQALLSVAGVSRAEVSYAAGTAQVETASNTSTSALLDAVRVKGYGAEMAGGACCSTAPAADA